MKSEYKDILNALVEMQQSHIYAARKQTLFYAEQAIFALEQKLLLSEPKKPECAWVPDVDDCRAFETTCGNAFVLNDGDPRTNGVLFCPYCGGKLKNAVPNVGLGVDMCRCGKNPAKELHSCPFAEEINGNDDPEFCTCCDDCRHECCMDI